MAYQINFKSLKNTTYHLLIGSGAVSALDGAADTFTTSEDDDTDFFKPVRTQSGSFRYVGSGSGDRNRWLAMIPQNALSIPVKLTHTGSNDIDWQGYIQPQVYHNDYPANGSTTEHEFSVQCPLSVLDTIDIDVSGIGTTPVVTIGQLLQNYIFGRLTGTTITGYYLQGTALATWSRLSLKVMMQNFVEVDSTGALRAKYNCMQVLEDVCKVFGYTCRMHGSYIYFTMPVTKTGQSEVGFTYYPSLTSVDGRTYAARGSFNLTDAMFCNMNNHEEVLPGIGTATVRSNINKLDNLIEIPYDELYDQYNTGQSDTIVRSVDYYEHEVYNLVRIPNANGGSMTYENDTVSLICNMESVPGTGHDGGNGKRYCRFFVYDDDDVGSIGGSVPESKLNYSWRKCIDIFKSYNYSGSASNIMFKITSKQAFVISDGILYIDFKCHEVSAWLVGGAQLQDGTKLPCSTCKIKIGNKYWNGSAWTTTDSTFHLPFTSEGAKTNRTSVNDPQYNGFGIPITDTMRGILEFTVVDAIPFQTIDSFQVVSINGFMPLMDFEIGFVRGTIEDTKHQGNEYVIKGENNKFREEYNVDLIFACDVAYGPSGYTRHMPAGLGYILDGTTEKPVATIQSVNGTQVIAEQELAQLIAQYGQTTHRLVEMDVYTNLVGSVVPTAMSTGLETGMFPLAISHDWREDITTLTLIEV